MSALHGVTYCVFNQHARNARRWRHGIALFCGRNDIMYVSHIATVIVMGGSYSHRIGAGAAGSASISTGARDGIEALNYY